MPLSLPEAILLAIAINAYVGAFVAAFVGLRRGQEANGRGPRAALVVALIAHSATFGSRAWRLGDLGLTDLTTTVLFLTACCTLIGLVVDARENVRSLPLFLVPPIATALGLGTTAALDQPVLLPPLGETASIALRIHVGTAFVAYAAFALSAVLGLMYLRLLGALKQKRLGSVARGMPPLERLDRLALGATSTGVILLGLSLLVGVLAQRATGVLGPEWLKDGKTLLAFGTWAAYAIVAALRGKSVLLGRRMAWANVVVFGLVVLTWLGTPLILGSSHPRG
jgi:ABC-type uncharacterized transport system permease subunit